MIFGHVNLTSDVLYPRMSCFLLLDLCPSGAACAQKARENARNAWLEETEGSLAVLGDQTEQKLTRLWDSSTRDPSAGSTVSVPLPKRVLQTQAVYSYVQQGCIYFPRLFVLLLLAPFHTHREVTRKRLVRQITDHGRPV
jgi:hypothetical protein